MRNEPEMYFYIAERGWPKDYIFGIDLSSLEKKKKKKKPRCHTLELHIWFELRKVCSQLLCASGRCGESLAGARKPRLTFLSFSACQRFPERV